jgi:hypothetical protein
MKVRFLTAALIELEEAAGYYDKSRPGLRDELYKEVEAALTLIAESSKPRAKQDTARAATTSNAFRNISSIG